MKIYYFTANINYIQVLCYHNNTAQIEYKKVYCHEKAVSPFAMWLLRIGHNNSEITKTISELDYNRKQRATVDKIVERKCFFLNDQFDPNMSVQIILT